MFLLLALSRFVFVSFVLLLLWLFLQSCATLNNFDFVLNLSAQDWSAIYDLLWYSVSYWLVALVFLSLADAPRGRQVPRWSCPPTLWIWVHCHFRSCCVHRCVAGDLEDTFSLVCFPQVRLIPLLSSDFTYTYAQQSSVLNNHTWAFWYL